MCKGPGPILLGSDLWDHQQVLVCRAGHGSWDKQQNPTPINHIIPNSATVGGPGTTQFMASCFLDPNGCLIENYMISQRVGVVAIIV